jgi:S-DNA-T family DNA segregation ATPase FtsK/SpoIIIE
MTKKDTKKDSEESANYTKRNGKSGSQKQKKIQLKEETRYSLWGIGFIVLGLLITLSVFNMAGVVGEFIYNSLSSFLGFGYYLLPILLVIIGYSFMKKERPQIAQTHAIFGLLVLLSSLGIMDIASNGKGESLNITFGGYLGGIFSWPFLKLFGIYAAILLLGTILITSLIILFDERPNLIELFKKFWNFLKGDIRIPNLKKDEYVETTEIPEVENKTKNEEIKNTGAMEYDESPINEKPIIEKEMKVKKFHTDYIPPPLSLLEKDKGKPNTGDMKGNMNIIQRTLLTFGVSVEMDEVTVGPTVTRYALKPAQGVKLSRIVGLQNELALALSAKTIRIEAPIPGKSLVGIEIPNKVKSTVGLATLLSDDKFQNSPKPLTVALGRGLSGKSIFGNLAKMPHLLVAGTTGSGKSVTIHSIITSLLYRNGPEDLRLILVDPKRVELTLYNKIPHLLTPVITDPKKTILSLKWAAREMDRRYDILQSESVQNIESYHANVYEKSKKDETAERLPYIVIVIDELADIMQTYPRELESAIVRLAQMSRAVGIHLILSTQRPSVNVITGLIKANIPTRVALQVSSQIDSRTILDQGGAEKLLGAGDMLYSCAETPQPERLQSAFISEEEVKKVVEYLRKAYIDEIPNTIELSGNIDKGGSSLFADNMGSDSEGDDDLYEDARLTVMEAGKASTSYLQRKLGIGYARAAKLIDMLEERGVIGPGNGAKPRDVLEKVMDNTEGVE